MYWRAADLSRTKYFDVGGQLPQSDSGEAGLPFTFPTQKAILDTWKFNHQLNSCKNNSFPDWVLAMPYMQVDVNEADVPFFLVVHVLHY